MGVHTGASFVGNVGEGDARDSVSVEAAEAAGLATAGLATAGLERRTLELRGRSETLDAWVIGAAASELAAAI